MAIMKETIPGYLKSTTLKGEPRRVEKGSIKRDLDVIIANVGTGIMKMKKRIPAKSFEQMTFPIENVYLYPYGTENGLRNPGDVTRIQTNVNDIFPDLVRKYKQMKMDWEQAMRQVSKASGKIEEYKKEIESLKKDKADLTDKITSLIDKQLKGGR